MQRYTVVVVGALTLAIPFDSSTLVSGFIEELFKRVAKHGLSLAPDTHFATLHLDSETGAIIDHEDVLSDVVTDPKNEKIFAVFAVKQTEAVINTSAAEQITTDLANSNLEDRILVRFITPALAKNKSSVQPVSISKSSTIKDLHELAASNLSLPAVFDKHAVDTECNCNLAKQLVGADSSSNQVLIVHSKSCVERFEISAANEAAINDVLSRRFGVTQLASKKVTHHGAEQNLFDTSYTKTPVVAICSKQRHIPVHARADEPDDSGHRFRLVDLHTSEQPVSSGSMDATLREAELDQLVTGGILDMYVVSRASTGTTTTSAGRNAIFRARPHWEPRVQQSDRGLAMFLSALRVFCHLVPSKDADRRMKDAVLHLFDLMTKFPPALRALLILIDGNTPTAAESSALAHAVYESLHDIIMPTNVIGTSKDRVFEASRLFFGFILDKARSVKLSETTVQDSTLPYLSSFDTTEIKDFKTAEPIMRMVRTTSGLVEKSLFTAFDKDGVLHNSPLQPNLVPLEDLPMVSRNALLSAGSAAEVLIFDQKRFASTCCYPDGGDVGAAVDVSELSDLNHLAELAARNQLALHRPSQLASAVAPCLTFDRKAHLAVYTGQAGCAAPGESDMVFRPSHGEETMNPPVVEQLIAPIIKQYEAEGTAVFDSFGGAVVRRLQAPDELLMFCVDNSASMRQATDFTEVNDTESPIPSSADATASDVVESDYYNKASFDEMKEYLNGYESITDMLAIITEAASYNRSRFAHGVLNLLRNILGNSILSKHQEREEKAQYMVSWHARQAVAQLDTALRTLKTQWAGLKTHEEALAQFLVYRATASPAVASKWQWFPGDELPTDSPPNCIPTLPEALTEVPDHLICPVSRDLMSDPVEARDGFTYSRQAIEQWFSIRKSSPMTGLPLNDTTLTPNDAVASQAADWILAKDVRSPKSPPAKKTRLSFSKTKPLKVTFLSKIGQFERTITHETTVNELYKIAFRGLKARFTVFQLALDESTALRPSTSTVSATGVSDGQRITIRLAEDMASSDPGASSSRNVIANDNVLVKVYHYHNLCFGFWAKRSATTGTLAAVAWKFWRYRFRTHGSVPAYDLHVWTDLVSKGDGFLNGCPQDLTENFHQFLNANHCHGKLEDEPVYSDGHPTPSNALASQPLVLKVDMQKRRTNTDRGPTKMSRLDVLKQLFEALINRSIAYGYKTHVGLITFATESKVKVPITHVVEQFRSKSSTMRPDGDTALWDALALAKDQLEEYAKKYPDARRRIIVISDGEDTKSTANTPQDVAWTLMQSKIVVDSIALGEETAMDLRALSYLLGGYAFHPTSLASALAMCELEPFLSLTERPDIKLPLGGGPFRALFHSRFFDAKRVATWTKFTNDSFPARKEHPNINDSFIQLSAASTRSSNTPSGNTGGARATLRMSRLMNELRSIVSNGGDRKFDVYVSERDMTFMKVVMSGPDESPYAGGTFLLYVHVGEKYPTFAPECRFVTRIEHPNISLHGKVCHALLSRDWTSDTSLLTVLDTIYGLLLQAETSDPVNTNMTLGYHHDQVEWADSVREHVRKYASKSREEWKVELLEGAEK